MYALITDDVVTEYPTSINAWRESHRNISLPAEPTEQQLNEVGIFNVVAAQKPSTAVDQMAEMSVENVDGVWTEVWAIRPATEEEASLNAAAIAAQYEQALTNHLDATAQARRYDNRVTCALRAGYAGPFQAEGQAFAQWMDACNAQAYSLLAQVQAGTAPAPESVGAFLAALPVMTWPD